MKNNIQLLVRILGHTIEDRLSEEGSITIKIESLDSFANEAQITESDNTS